MFAEYPPMQFSASIESMFGNFANVAVVSFLTVASSFISHRPHTRAHLISPLPRTSPSPTPLPTATPTPIPTATPTPTPLPTATPTPTPIITSSDLETLFTKYGQQNNVDTNELKRIANCESGFNTNAEYLDYKGMFQFSPESWSITRHIMGEDANPDLRTNPEEAIKTAAYKIAHGGSGAWPNCH